jgi:hypothetical protein
MYYMGYHRLCDTALAFIPGETAHLPMVRCERLTLGESHPMRPYWEYLAYLFRKLPVVPEEAAAENEYRDYLQAPLQPLQVWCDCAFRSAFRCAMLCMYIEARSRLLEVDPHSYTRDRGSQHRRGPFSVW